MQAKFNLKNVAVFGAQKFSCHHYHHPLMFPLKWVILQ